MGDWETAKTVKVRYLWVLGSLSNTSEQPPGPGWVAVRTERQCRDTVLVHCEKR
jgi:hypothetical protein